MPLKKIADKNLHLRNLNGHKKIHLRDIEKIHCCLRGIRGLAEDAANWIRGDSLINALKLTAALHPESLPSTLQAIEWELSKVVQDASELLKDAGEAMELCHNLRGGNETLCKLLKLREEALSA